MNLQVFKSSSLQVFKSSSLKVFTAKNDVSLSCSCNVTVLK